MTPACPFCDRLRVGPLEAQNDLAAAFLDAYPVSKGHCLIVPRRHEPDFFALAQDEQTAIWMLARQIQSNIEETLSPDGYNLGVNIGAAAGQTIDHAHLHVVPRFRGDVADPRGGVRWVVPTKAPYWETR